MSTETMLCQTFEGSDCDRSLDIKVDPVTMCAF